MPLNLDEIRTDADLELNGFWYDFGDAKMKIARLGNKNYRKLLNEKLPEYMRDTMDEDLRSRLLGEVIGATILLDWVNLAENGEDLPYSKQNAIRLMTTPEYKDLREFILDQANNAENYRRKHVEDIKKK